MEESNRTEDNHDPDVSANSSNNTSETHNQHLENKDNQQNDTNRPRKHPPRLGLVKKWIKRENNKSGIANIIAFIALLIGGFLAYYTLQVFRISEKQAQSVIDAGNAAKASAQIADKTLKETRTFDSITIANQKIADGKSDSALKIKTRHDDSVFKIQVATLKETQKEFDISNEPYIQIEKAGFFNFTVDSLAFVVFDLANLKDIPVKMIESRSGMVWEPKKPYMDTITTIKDKINYNQYLIKGSPFTDRTTFVQPITKVQVNYQRAIKNKLWIIKIVKYVDLTTHKTRIYKSFFSLEPLSGNRSYAEFYYNENYDEKAVNKL